MTFKNTGVICMIQVPDANREDGFRFVDVGNYFIDTNGKQCVVTSIENARAYKEKIYVPIYVRTGGEKWE